MNEELSSNILLSQKITLEYSASSKQIISFSEVSELLLDNIHFKQMNVDTLSFQGNSFSFSFKSLLVVAPKDIIGCFTVYYKLKLLNISDFVLHS